MGFLFSIIVVVAFPQYNVNRHIINLVSSQLYLHFLCFCCPYKLGLHLASYFLWHSLSVLHLIKFRPTCYTSSIYISWVNIVQMGFIFSIIVGAAFPQGDSLRPHQPLVPDQSGHWLLLPLPSTNTITNTDTIAGSTLTYTLIPEAIC